MVRIPQNQISSRKQIGHTTSGRPVIAIALQGGLHLVVVAKSSGFETLAASSHSGMSRYMAEQADPDIVFDVQKSESFDPKFFQDLLPEYQELTRQIQEAQRGR